MSIFDKSVKSWAKAIWEWYDDVASVLGHAVIIGYILYQVFG